jgi:hypothetical protein
MDKEKQRIKIAEECGWTEIENCTCTANPSRGFSPLGGDYKKHLPDYLNDLNAMHSAERSLSKEERRTYGEILVKIVTPHHPLGRITLYLKNPVSGEQIFTVANITASQRAEAFLRTLSLWEDEA